MSKGEHWRFTAEQKLEFLRKAKQPGGTSVSDFVDFPVTKFCKDSLAAHNRNVEDDCNR